MKKITLTTAVILCLAQTSFGQVNYWATLVYFGGNRINHIPKGIVIPDKDRQSKLIMNNIISGLSEAGIKQLFPDSFEVKVTELIRGNVVRREGDRLVPTFPVMIGQNRKQLQHIIHEKIKKILPSIDSLVFSLRLFLAHDPKMIFHFLWSRIIDDCWWDLYNSEFKTDQGPPNIAFIVYPLHRFQCGTNFDYTKDDAQIAISWSYNIFNDFDSLPKTLAFYNLASNKPISGNDRNFFTKHGLLNPNNIPTIYTYNEQGALDSLCDALKKKYIGLLQGLYDYKKLGKKFNIPPEDLFVLVSHETAYEIFQLLHGENRSLYFPIVSADNPTCDLSSLLSIKLPKL